MRLLNVVILLISASAVRSEDCTRIATFNAGLTRRVPKYEIRRNDIPKAIVELDADVVCLQEYWRESDLKILISTVDKIYPHHISFLNVEKQDNSTTGACSDADVKYFHKNIIPCAKTNGCMDYLRISVAAALSCLARKCKAKLKNNKIHADCLSCIAVTSPKENISLADCTGKPQESNRLNGPGLVLLSKTPLINARTVRFFPRYRMMFPRGYLVANHSDVPRIICTHLSSHKDPYMEYDLSFNNYLAQQEAEARIILKTYGFNKYIVLGNLNTGPPSVGQYDTLEEKLNPDDYFVYDYLRTWGYFDNYDYWGSRKCTFCKSNPLTLNGTNEIFDIIFEMNLPTASYLFMSFERVLDKEPLSDHYGVQGSFCKK